MFPSIISLITIIFWLLSKPSLTFIFNNPLLSLSQLASLLGSVLLAFTFILSSRFNFLEKIFGSLDKIYKKHHLWGAISFLLLITHPLLLALQAFGNSISATIYLLPSSNLTYSAGVLALYSLILFLAFTLLIKLPYHLWYLSHQFMVIVLFFALYHTLFISSDLSRFPILKIWIMTWLFLALVSALYKRFFYTRFGPKFIYRVANSQNTNGFLDIKLSPTQKLISFYPGQFVFISFRQAGISQEYHPFTIASSPNSSHLRICAKAIGDYTHELTHLQADTPAWLFGPYGQLHQLFHSHKNLVLIAGGIGITPFMAMIETEIVTPQKRHLNLFYTAKNSLSAINHSLYLRLSTKNIHFKYHPIFTDLEPRLNAKTIQKLTPHFSSSLFIICGPSKLINDIKNQLISLKINPKNIYYEDFYLT